MPSYGESDNVGVRSSNGNIKPANDKVSKSSKNSIFNEARDGSPDQSAYVRIVKLEHEAKDGSMASSIGASMFPHNSFVQEHVFLNVENVDLHTYEPEKGTNNPALSVNDRSSDPSLHLTSKDCNHGSLQFKYTVHQHFDLATDKHACSSDHKKHAIMKDMVSPNFLKNQEEEDAALKQLRRSMKFKATPMPSFYQEGPPPKTELKKVPPTRAKSTKFNRRKSCNDASNPSPVGCTSKPNANVNRRSLDSARDARKSLEIKNVTPLSQAKGRGQEGIKAVLDSDCNENVTVQEKTTNP
ncbi:Protein WAVE-dampened 2 [Apostasia shenzhenica]|uniref:Protein WAVE-dampened 2 n=1 Tax=Apostasia shenzhenica TaxID=1088818 RepID=A0A2I0B0W3_9ASPA|nr:Protein WAVE-dampened 2 [Apostasia shenzhenica]